VFIVKSKTVWWEVMKVPLLFPGELTKTILKSVHESKGGHVSFPDEIFARNLLVESTDDKFIQEYKKTHDFHLAEFQVVVNPKPEYSPTRVSVSGTLNPWTPALGRPTVRHIFPSTEFVDPNWKISGKFGVSLGEGFKQLPSEGEFKIEFNYAPKIARVDSGTTGSNFSWNFRSAKNEAPQGGLDLKVVLMRPSTVEQMKVFFELEVEFDRKLVPFIGNDTARATGESQIQFNPSPV
jgi:hypothetical protein